MSSLLVKPLHHKQPDERSRTVTLIAGLVTDTGIVFASDSEESGVYRKASVEKILSQNNPSGSSIVISGAGHGHLIDYTAQRILKEATQFRDLSRALQQIEEILKEVFSDHVKLQPVRDIRDADFQLLIGIKASAEQKAYLYSTSGIALIEQKKYHVCGSGALVDYLLAQSYHDPMSREDAVCACLNLLTVAKEYVDGVGGESHVTILANGGDVIEKPSWEVIAEENLVKKFNRQASGLMLATLRTGSNDNEKQFADALTGFGTETKDLRQEKKKSDEIVKELVKRWREFQARQEKERKEKEAAAAAAALEAAAKPPSSG